MIRRTMPTRSIARGLGVLLAILVEACWLTRPVILHMPNRVIDHPDAMYTVWALNHNYVALSTGDWRGYWQAPMLTPYKYSLALADPHLGTALWTFPAYLISGSPVVAYNTAIIGSFAISGVAGYVLVSFVTRRHVIALLIALAAMAIPFRLAQFVHLQVLMMPWFLLAVWCLLRCAARPHAGWVWGFAGCCLMTLFSSLYYGMFQVLLLGPTGLVMAVRGRWYSPRVLLRSWIWAALVTMPAAVWFLLPFYLVYGSEGFERSLPDIINGSAKPLDYLRTATQHLAVRFGLQRTGEFEFALFPGFTLAAAAMLSLIIAARKQSWLLGFRSQLEQAKRWIGANPALSLGIGSAALIQLCWLFAAPFRLAPIDLKFDYLPVPWRTISGTYLLVCAFSCALVASPILWQRKWIQSRSIEFWCWVGVVIFVLLSFGPVIRHGDHWLAIGPYALLFRFAPGYQGMRVPARMVMLIEPLLLIIAGLTFATLADSVRSVRYRLLVIAMPLILLTADLAVGPPAWREVPERPDYPAAFRWLEGNGQPGGLLVLPPDSLQKQPSPEYLFLSMYHRRPLLNGYPAFMPHDCEAALSSVRSFPQAAALETLRLRNIRYVILDRVELTRELTESGLKTLIESTDRSPDVRRVDVGESERFVLYEVIGTQKPR